MYCLVLNVQSSSSVIFTDVLGFVVRKGLTTTISGSYHKTGESSGSIYIEPVENEKPSTSPTGVETISPPTTSTNAKPEENGTIVDEITSGMIYQVQGDSENKIVIGHSSGEIATNDHKNSRLNVPNGTKFAMNLNGTNVYLSKLQNNGRPSEGESALVAELNDESFMTLYNNKVNSTGADATFAILLDTPSNMDKAYHRRLQSNIQIDNSTLNVVGSGASDDISNGKIVFVGPTSVHTNLNTKEFRQGAINLKGTGGIVNLDGNVSVQGLFGITSWNINGSSNTTKDSSISGVQETSIVLKNHAKIETSSDSSCENALDKAGAHGIYLYGNINASVTGAINITLTDSEIKTTSAGIVTSAGIRIENISSEIRINITNSSITATNGYGIYLSNCPNVTITYSVNCSVSGTKGDIYVSNSTVNNKQYGSSEVISVPATSISN